MSLCSLDATRSPRPLFSTCTWARSTWAAALLVPALAAFGLFLLVPTMIGAAATHLFLTVRSAESAAVPLAGLLIVGWARRDSGVLDC
jgi:hypothetical protein